MKITNKHNLPELVVNALTFDTYSRGESDISITQLIDSPRISLLERQHSDEIEQDFFGRDLAHLSTRCLNDLPREKIVFQKKDSSSSVMGGLLVVQLTCNRSRVG